MQGKRREITMSTNVMTAPIVKSTGITMKQAKTERKELVAAALNKDITRDPEFWKQATLS
jgi:hypothetical protein